MAHLMSKPWLDDFCENGPENQKNSQNIHDMHSLSSSLVYNHSDGGCCLQKAGDPALTAFSRAYPTSLGKNSKKCQMHQIKYRLTPGTFIDQHDQPIGIVAEWLWR
jgi:hypothetical protein